MNYYIGIDGGGSKTQYGLFDEKKNMASTVKTGGSNHETLDGGIPAAADVLMEGINQLLLKNAMRQEQISFVLMALAGMDHPYQEAALRDELKKRGLNVPLAIYNDGFIVVKAGVSGKAGIGYNCGTGTCCNSIDNSGKLLQIGGFGALSGDVGGGVWIAGRVFRMVYDDVCLGVRPTVCTRAFCENFGVNADREGVLSMVSRLEAEDDATVRDMIDIFFDAVNAGDPVACGVAEEMAQRGAEFIAAHLKKGYFTDDPVEVVLSGSIHTKLPSDAYIASLQEAAQRLSGRKLKFIKLTVPPVTGCINWMLEDQ